MATLREEMHRAARRAPHLLRESSDLIREFLLGQLHVDGGFLGRDGSPDLYYTVFGVESLLALGERVPDRLGSWLTDQGRRDDLDLVHLSCLARCDAALEGSVLGSSGRARVAARLRSFRSTAGGYHNEPGRPSGSLYGTFLALGAHQDVGVEIPDPTLEAGILDSLRTPDGGWANEKGVGEGTTPATSAAIELWRHLRGSPPPPGPAADWLLAQERDGGFLAGPRAPIPDLLSTATALHSLSSLGPLPASLRESSLAFVDGLWTRRGSFFAHWAETRLDCEYTFYGLLAIGHLTDEHEA